MANTPNISRDSFNFGKWYTQVVLQQGVPIVDSDWNELGDLQLIEKILRGAYLFGDMFLPADVDDLDGATNPGYKVQQATSTTNNFKISGGWVLCKGLLVPTTAAEPPADHDYDDDTNRMGEGAITSVDGGLTRISDTEQNWQTFHDLVGCRIKMTSGVESGNSFTVVSRINATTLQLSSVGSIAATDTYIIKPPALTTPSGSDRDDEVYLMVWIEDISEVEDSNLTHPGTGICSAHRKQVRWCVRVEENGTTPTTPSVHTVASAGSVRYAKMAELARLDSDASITTAMITPEPSSSRLSVSAKIPDLLIAQPANKSATLVATNKFQLTGTFYVGTEYGAPAQNDPTAFFSVHENSALVTRRIPWESGGNLIYVTQIRNSSDSAALDMANDPDENGFYTNPYIVLSQSLSTTVYIYCFEKKYLREMEQKPALLVPAVGNDILPHGSIITGLAQSGTPNSLTAGTLSNQLGQILTDVNATMRKATQDTVTVNHRYEHVSDDDGSVWNAKWVSALEASLYDGSDLIPSSAELSVRSSSQMPGFQINSTTRRAQWSVFLDEDWDTAASTDVIVEVWVSLGSGVADNDEIKSRLRRGYHYEHSTLNSTTLVNTDVNHSVATISSLHQVHRIVYNFTVGFGQKYNIYSMSFSLTDVTSGDAAPEVYFLGAMTRYRSLQAYVPFSTDSRYNQG